MTELMPVRPLGILGDAGKAYLEVSGGRANAGIDMWGEFEKFTTMTNPADVPYGSAQGLDRKVMSFAVWARENPDIRSKIMRVVFKNAKHPIFQRLMPINYTEAGVFKREMLRFTNGFVERTARGTLTSNIVTTRETFEGRMHFTAIGFNTDYYTKDTKESAMLYAANMERAIGAIWHAVLLDTASAMLRRTMFYTRPEQIWAGMAIPEDPVAYLEIMSTRHSLLNREPQAFGKLTNYASAVLDQVAGPAKYVLMDSKDFAFIKYRDETNTDTRFAGKRAISTREDVSALATNTETVSYGGIEGIMLPRMLDRLHADITEEIYRTRMAIGSHWGHRADFLDVPPAEYRTHMSNVLAASWQTNKMDEYTIDYGMRHCVQFTPFNADVYKNGDRSNFDKDKEGRLDYEWLTEMANKHIKNGIHAASRANYADNEHLIDVALAVNPEHGLSGKPGEKGERYYAISVIGELAETTPDSYINYIQEVFAARVFAGISLAEQKDIDLNHTYLEIKKLKGLSGFKKLIKNLERIVPDHPVLKPPSGQTKEDTVIQWLFGFFTNTSISGAKNEFSNGNTAGEYSTTDPNEAKKYDDLVGALREWITYKPDAIFDADEGNFVLAMTSYANSKSLLTAFSDTTLDKLRSAMDSAYESSTTTKKKVIDNIRNLVEYQKNISKPTEAKKALGLTMRHMVDSGFSGQHSVKYYREIATSISAYWFSMFRALFEAIGYDFNDSNILTVERALQIFDIPDPKKQNIIEELEKRKRSASSSSPSKVVFKDMAFLSSYKLSDKKKTIDADKSVHPFWAHASVCDISKSDDFMRRINAAEFLSPCQAFAARAVLLCPFDLHTMRAFSKHDIPPFAFVRYLRPWETRYMKTAIWCADAQVGETNIDAAGIDRITQFDTTVKEFTEELELAHEATVYNNETFFVTPGVRGDAEIGGCGKHAVNEGLSREHNPRAWAQMQRRLGKADQMGNESIICVLVSYEEAMNAPKWLDIRGRFHRGDFPFLSDEYQWPSFRRFLPPMYGGQFAAITGFGINTSESEIIDPNSMSAMAMAAMRERNNICGQAYQITYNHRAPNKQRAMQPHHLVGRREAGCKDLESSNAVVRHGFTGGRLEYLFRDPPRPDNASIVNTAVSI